MSKDEGLKQLKRRRMAELMKRLQTRKAEEGRKRGDPKSILRRILTDRAWEVLRGAEGQYPEATRRIEDHLAHLVSEGELEGPILGGQLLRFFRSLGMNVRLETHIRILEHGKLKTIGEKLRETEHRG